MCFLWKSVHQTVEVGFRNMLSFIRNYIIREVEPIYSNKSSRICSDRYTSERILLNGLIYLLSPPIPLMSRFLCSFSIFLGICLGRCFAFHCFPAVCCLDWSHSSRLGSAGPGAALAQRRLGGPGCAGASAAPGTSTPTEISK